MTPLASLLAEAERVLEGVTPGPWRVEEQRWHCQVLASESDGTPWEVAETQENIGAAHDAAFIAAARTLLPALLAALRTPPSEEDWRGVMREHHDWCRHRVWPTIDKWRMNRFAEPVRDEDWVCSCGASDHNALLAALRARVEAERERTRRVVEAARDWAEAVPRYEDRMGGFAARLIAAVRELPPEVIAVRDLRGEP